MVIISELASELENLVQSLLVGHKIDIEKDVTVIPQHQVTHYGQKAHGNILLKIYIRNLDQYLYVKPDLKEEDQNGE